MQGMDWLVLFAIGLPAALIALDNPGSTAHADTGPDADDATLGDGPTDAPSVLLLVPDDVVDALGAASATPQADAQGFPADTEGQDRLAGNHGKDVLHLDIAQASSDVQDDPTGFDDGSDSAMQSASVIEGFDPAEDVLVVQSPEGAALDLRSQSVQDGNLIVSLSDGASFVLAGVTAPIDADAVMVVDG